MRNPCRQRRLLSSQPCRPVRSEVMRNPLARPQTLAEGTRPGNCRTHTVMPCSGQLLHVHEPRTMNSLAADNLLAHSRTRAATLAIWLNKMPSTQKPADAEGKLGQAQRHRRVVQYLRKRTSYATIGVTHSGTSTGRLAQRERRCLTSTRSQVQILYRPPLKSQVRHFLSDLFFFQGNQGKQVPDKLAAIGHARFPPIHRAHKNGRRLTPTPENQRAFTLKARLSNAGKRTHLPFYGPGTHRRPGENPPYAPQARFLHANSKRPPAQPTALKLCDSHVTTRKTPNGYVETCRADALRFIPLARPSRPRASRAHGQAMPPWRRRRAYGRSRRAARRRTTAAGRSGASRRRRLSW